MRKVLLPIFLLSISLAVLAQGLVMKATPSSVSIVPGEPISVEIAITNASGKKMEVLGQSLETALAPFPLLYTRTSEKLDCSGGLTSPAVWGDESIPYSARPHRPFEANATVTIPAIVGSHTMCPLQSVPPGNYVAKLTVEIDLLEGESKRTASAELEIPVEVRQAQGSDAAYLDALQKALIQYEAENKNAKFSGQPLKWIEVLTPLRLPCREIVLEKFPTSTYAGYVLANLYPILPGVGKTTDEIVEKLSAADFFERFPKTYDHENPPPKGPWIPMRKAVDARACLIRNFLVAHPDFRKREILEEQLGLLSIPLGRYQDAYQSFSWVAANGGEKASSSKELKDSMNKRGLAGEKGR